MVLNRRRRPGAFKPSGTGSMPSRGVPKSKPRIRFRIDWMNVLIVLFLGINLVFIGFGIRQCRKPAPPEAVKPPVADTSAVSAPAASAEQGPDRNKPQAPARETVKGSEAGKRTPTPSARRSEGQAKTQKSAIPPSAVSARATFQVEVLNGCGIPKIADRFTEFLRERGFDVVKTGNYETFNVPKTLVIARRGDGRNAVRLADALGLRKRDVIQELNALYTVDATVILGKDFRLLASWAALEKKRGKN
jgi:hypothetical protein